MTPLSCEEVGDLAAGFVLGALTAEEDGLVRAHLASCAELHEELAELGGVAPYLLDSVEPVEPSGALKGRIMAAAAADLAARQGEPAAVVDEAGSRGAPEVAAFPTAAERAERAARAGRTERAGRLAGRRRTSPVQWVAAVAAVLVVAALGAWNLGLQRELDTARDYQRGLSAVLDLAAQAGSETAILTAAGGGTGPSGLAAIGSDGRVAIVMRSLTPTAGTEVYEAWVIGSSGDPVPIGDFRVGAGGTASVTVTGAPVEPGVTLALTREPGPGATTPTEPILALGKAVAAGS